MNIISTFINIAKKETVHRSGIKELIKDMHEDSISYRKEHQDEASSAIQEGFTREQFVKAYKNLQMTTVVSSSFLAFMIAYIFTSEDFIGFFSIGAFVAIGLFWHFSFVVRAYRARVVWDIWDKRHQPLVVSTREVFESLFSDPKIFFPFLCNLNVQEKLHYVNIGKKKSLKKGDANVKKN